MEQTFGKYKVLRELGKGGMGIVYKGLDPATQKEVAIKVLPATMVERTTVERFNREAAAMAKLKHPNLAEVYEVAMTHGQHFYAMEFIEGDTLTSIIKNRGPLPISACLDIIIQVSSALSCIHKQGMIHRDIKPGNIMINKDGKAKLMDFGLVQIQGATRVTVEGASVGTAEYMSPEQISEDEIDERSDIYSWGATIYELLSGRPPFEGASFQSVLMKHKYESPPTLRSKRSDIPAELERIVLKTLAKEPSQRYQNVQELLDEVTKLKGTAAGKSAPSGRTEVMSKPTPVKKEKSVIRINLNVAPLLFILIVAGGLYYTYIHNEAFRNYVSAFLKRPAAQAPQEDLTEQAEDYFKSLEMAEQHYLKAQEYDRKGKYSSAILEYKKAIRQRKDYALYYYDLAQVYEKRKDKINLIKTWQDLLKNAPDSSYAAIAQEEIEKLTQK